MTTEKKPGYTIGKWVIYKSQKYIWIVSPETTICELYDARGAAEANARLIVSAPEMVEALKVAGETIRYMQKMSRLFRVTGLYHE